MAARLSFAGVTRRIGEVHVLDRLDLAVEPEEIVAIVGPSGCGKSTLLRLAAGLDHPEEGSIVVGGRAVSDPSHAVGLVFQEPRLLPWLDVLANVEFGAKPEKPDRARAQELLGLVGLVGFESKWPWQLSGGMAQRAALARALMGSPEVLLLDEPFSALDAFTRMRLQDMLLAVWERYRPTIVLVTHDLDEALYLSDRVVRLGDRPARVEEVIPVALERPRDRRDPTLIGLRGELLEAFGLAHV